MTKFEYDISIVMPIYNAEKYISESLDSILNQDTKGISYEVLMINDGSTDNSEKICLKYKSENKNFKYMYKKNSGVSESRNLGIDTAKGKYILFLDADDMLTPETLEHIFRLFERFQDEACILTYPLNKYVDGEIVEHVRSKNYFTEGLFNVDNFTTLNQCTINTVIKNLPPEERCHFNKQLHQSEDALFNTQMIMKNGKIIISSKGSYLYRTDHQSTVNKYANPAAIKNMLLDFFRELIKLQKNGVLHPYIQSMILYEINWRFKGNVLYPNYLKGTEREAWDASFQKVMDFIDTETIINQDHMDIYHKYYFIDKYKGNISLDFDSSGIKYFSNNFMFSKVSHFTMVFSKMTKKNNRINVYGFLKATLLQYLIDDLQLVMRTNGEDTILNLMPNSTEGYYKSKNKIAEFYDFDFDFSIESDAEYEFWVIYKGLEFKVASYLKNSVYFQHIIGLDSVVIDNKVLHHQEKTNRETLSIKVSSDPEEIKETKKKLEEKLKQPEYRNLLIFNRFYELTKNYYKKRKIWLYNDRIGVFDNSFIQFEHDLNKKDKIDRYYIISKEDLENDRLKNIPKSKLIIRNSVKHKILFVFSELIITSFKDYAEYCPLSFQFFNSFYHNMNYKLIYLQHGILHAHTPWLYSKHYTNIDKFLVSSKFEAENLIENYGYKDINLIKTGMPRLTSQKEEKINKANKILFAPSWRISITRGQKDGVWLTDEDEFKSSEYYKGIMELLNNEKLNKLLKDYKYQIDIKLHPIFKEMGHLFNVKNDQINLIEDKLNLSEYKVLITDFSSFLFDFIENKTKIMMFYPDYDYFVSGNHIYSKLDFDLSPISKEYKESETLVADLEGIIETNCVLNDSEDKFYSEFFYDIDDRKEELYKCLIEIK